MRGKRGSVVLAALITLVSLTALGTGTVLRPAPLQAQTCGSFDGKLCKEECNRECTNGSCCSWSYYYYAPQIT